MVKLTIWDTNLNPSNAYALTVPIHEPLGLRLAAGSDSRILGDNITNVITPVIIGTGNPGDTVPLYEGNIVVGSGVVGSGGSWSITASPLAAGAHSLTGAETDSRGNISVPSSPALVLTIQSPPPPPPGTNLTSATPVCSTPRDRARAISTGTGFPISSGRTGMARWPFGR